MKIRIVTKNTEDFAELNGTKAAFAIADALPFESTAYRWVEEVYFKIPLELEPERQGST